MVLLLLPWVLTLSSQDPPQDTIAVADSTDAKVFIVKEMHTSVRPADTIYMELTKQQRQLEEIIEKKKQKK